MRVAVVSGKKDDAGQAGRRCSHRWQARPDYDDLRPAPDAASRRKGAWRSAPGSETHYWITHGVERCHDTGECFERHLTEPDRGPSPVRILIRIRELPGRQALAGRSCVQRYAASRPPVTLRQAPSHAHTSCRSPSQEEAPPRRPCVTVRNRACAGSPSRL